MSYTPFDAIQIGIGPMSEDMTEVATEEDLENFTIEHPDDYTSDDPVYLTGDDIDLNELLSGVGSFDSDSIDE